MICDEAVGSWLIAAGLLLLVGGLLAWTGALSRLGNLPGDIRISRATREACIPSQWPRILRSGFLPA